MRAVTYPAAEKARCLVVLFPGMGDSAESFAQHGFIEAIAERQLAIDVVAANATIGYYTKETLWPRVETDVIAPARARGYDTTWFVGVSMGGMGAILTALRETNSPDGLLLLSPFLGEKKLIQEIADAGGMTRWEPGPLSSEIQGDSYQRHAWRWLKQTQINHHPIVFLATGNEDKLIEAANVLAAGLPPSNVDRIPGRHHWATWKELWSRFLDHSPLVAQCSTR